MTDTAKAVAEISSERVNLAKIASQKDWLGLGMSPLRIPIWSSILPHSGQPAISFRPLWVDSGCSRCGRATAAWGRRLPLAVPMNERLLVAVGHPKPAVPVSANSGPPLPHPNQRTGSKGSPLVGVQRAAPSCGGAGALPGCVAPVTLALVVVRAGSATPAPGAPHPHHNQWMDSKGSPLVGVLGATPLAGFRAAPWRFFAPCDRASSLRFWRGSA